MFNYQSYTTLQYKPVAVLFVMMQPVSATLVSDVLSSLPMLTYTAPPPSLPANGGKHNSDRNYILFNYQSYTIKYSLIIKHTHTEYRHNEERRSAENCNIHIDCASHHTYAIIYAKHTVHTAQNKHIIHEQSVQSHIPTVSHINSSQTSCVVCHTAASQCHAGVRCAATSTNDNSHSSSTTATIACTCMTPGHHPKRQCCYKSHNLFKDFWIRR